MTKLTKLLDGAGDLLPDEIAEILGTAAELDELAKGPAGSDEPFVLLDSDEDKLEGEGQITVFDQPFDLSADASADLLIHPLPDSVAILEFTHPVTGEPVFDDGTETLTARDDRALCELKVQLGASIQGSASGQISAATISANLGAGGGVSYRHIRPSPQESSTRAEALASLLETSALPALVSFQQLEPDEIHVLEGMFNFDFGIKASLGGQAEAKIDLEPILGIFDGSPADIQLNVEYGLEASFGFSLYEQVQIAIGRFNVVVDDELENDDWLRMRIQRLRRRELTLGAKLSLQVEYDLASESFTALLDRLLELDPTARLAEQLEEVQSHFDDQGSFDWDKIKERLVSEVGESLNGFLEEGWEDWIAADDREKIDEALGKITDLAKEYAELPDKARSLWGSVLSSINLGEGSSARKALQKLADLPTTPEELDEKLDSVVDGLLDDDWQEALLMLETLGGRSISELIVGRDTDILKALEDAQTNAAKALNFLDNGPQGTVDLIQSFAEKAGIEGTLQWFQDNASTLEDLQKEANERITDIVEKWLGKKLDDLELPDFQQLGKILDRLQALLEKKDEWEEKIRGYLGYLKGKAGIELSLALTRLTEKQALVDLEFDPEKPEVREPVRDALSHGAVAELVAALPEADTMTEAGYRLNEAVFSSRRTRSSVGSIVASWLGVRTRTVSRIDESTIRLTQVGADGTGPGGRLLRTAQYSGGVTKGRSASKGPRSVKKEELSASLRLQLKGMGGDLAQSYDELESSELRVTFSRDDDDTLARELDGLETLLQRIGFPVEAGELTGLSDDPIDTSLSIDLRLGDAAVNAFLTVPGAGLWNDQYLDAAERWFDDVLAEKKDRQGNKLRKGQVNAALVGTDEFLAHWGKKEPDFLRGVDRIVEVQVGDRTTSVVLKQGSGAGSKWRNAAVKNLVVSRENSFRTLGKLRSQWLDVQPPDGQMDPGALRRIVKRASTMWRDTAGTSGWGSVLFNLWLAYARVSDLETAALEQAKGLALMQWKAVGADAWEKPLRWQLADGLPDTWP